MKSKRERILELCEFSEKDFGKNHPGDWTPYTFDQMAKVANDKQKPIITALLLRVEQLEGALEKNIQAIYELSSESATTEMSRDELVMLECRLTKKAHYVYKELKQALTATSPLDEILKGEK